MADWVDRPTETGYWWFLGNEKYSRPEIVWYAATGNGVFHHGEDEVLTVDEDDQGKYLGPVMPPDDRFRADCHFVEDHHDPGTKDHQ